MSIKFDLDLFFPFAQACSFLNTYKELRGECQEVYYNLGRAMHQLGLLPAAIFYYKKVHARVHMIHMRVHTDMLDRTFIRLAQHNTILLLT